MNRTLHPRPSNEYIVAPDYDLTPKEMWSLDYYIKDSDVMNIIKHVMVAPVALHDWSDWAANNPDEASWFFLHPYPFVAIQVLGYSNNDNNGQYAPGFNAPIEDVFHHPEKNDAINYIVNEEGTDQEQGENTD